MWIDGNLLIIDIYRLWDAIWKGVLIALPIWCTYLVIKIKITDWLNKRRITR